MDKATRKRIVESDYGRKFGWFVESEGRRLATLTEPEWDSVAQFWYVYKLTPLTDSPEDHQRLASEGFWQRTDIVYRNREFDMLAPHVLAALKLDGRVAARGLDLYHASQS